MRVFHECEQQPISNVSVDWCECARGFERVAVYLYAHLKGSTPIRGPVGVVCVTRLLPLSRGLHGVFTSPVAPMSTTAQGHPYPSECLHLIRNAAGDHDARHSFAGAGGAGMEQVTRTC